MKIKDCITTWVKGYPQRSIEISEERGDFCVTLKFTAPDGKREKLRLNGVHLGNVINEALEMAFNDEDNRLEY